VNTKWSCSVSISWPHGSTFWTWRPCCMYGFLPLAYRTPTAEKHNFIQGWTFLYMGQCKMPILCQLFMARENYFQTRFSVNVWCILLGKKLTGLFTFNHHLTGNIYHMYLRNQLPGLLEYIPLMTRRKLYFQRNRALPHYIRLVRKYLLEWEVHWFPRSTLKNYCDSVLCT
jgi:hypothetical protein